jgi:hypothetical protein
VFDIDREHPEYKAKRAAWRKYRDLYAGGEQFSNRAAEYLIPRHKEPVDVYNERLSRVFYENYIGSIVDWYAATLFRREPIITFDGENSRAKAFFSEFTDNCDLRGTNFTDFLRGQLIEALVEGTSYILVDFPRHAEPVGSRAEEDARGVSRAFVVGCSPRHLINWSYDEKGSLEWVVLRTESLRKDSVEDNDWRVETRWTYYDKQEFRAYRKLSGTGSAGAVELVDRGFHGLAKQRQVPLFRMEVPDGLWLLNRAGSLQLEHFNKSNALSWALTMGLFATPVVYSDRKFNQMVGESYYIQLGPEDKFGWTEPQGNVYQIAAENLVRLQEEIYRVCYLTQLGGPLDATSRSGLSKQRDFAFTQEVLRAYGDSVKDLARKVLRAVSEAREDELLVDVSGLDEFDIGDFSAELADAERLLGLGIQSPTFVRQMQRRLALKYLCDVRQDVKDRIAAEIDGGAN